MSGSGPWNNLDPKQYFSGAIGWGGDQLFGMRSEMGTATFTNVESFKKFMPESSWWPRNQMWNKHFFGSSASNAGPDGYHADLFKRYGASGNIKEYCQKSQLLNLETMQALYEGWLDRSDTDAAGMIIWMSQAAYPSFVWQTYDYYYDLTGSYFGVKKGYEGLKAEAWIYNMDGKQQYNHSVTINSSCTKVADCFNLVYQPNLSSTHFIKLRLTDKSGKVLSDNFYWRGKSDLNYKALNTIAPVKLVVKTSTSIADGYNKIIATITNPADAPAVAFAIRPKLVKAGTDEQILPVFIDDGYFSLVPGETKVITIRYKTEDAGNRQAEVKLECYNNQPKTLVAINDARNNNKGNLAFGRIVTGSSIESSGIHDPNAIVDGDANSYWASLPAKDSQWVSFDLGKSVDIKHIKLAWANAFATNYTIQVSDDKKMKKTSVVYETTEGKGGNEDLIHLTGHGRYIKLVCRNGEGNNEKEAGYGLKEIEVYDKE